MEPKTVEALRILSRILSEEGRKFVLIGAMVPQILIDLRQSSGLGSRETRDIDAVAEVASWEDFTKLCKRLEVAGFRAGSVAHELSFDGEVRIDLIPFGPALVKEEKLAWPYGDSVMTACGFEEAFECARDRQISSDLILPVVSLPGLILTKVVAYMDRPAERVRDLVDILYCFERYENAPESRRFDYAGVDAEGKAVTYEEAGAYLLGLEVAAMAKPSSLEIVRSFIDAIRDEYASAISRILTEEKRLADSNSRRAALYRLFRVFATGLNAGPKR